MAFGASDDRIEIKVTADTGSAESAFGRLQGKIITFNQALELAGKAFRMFESGVKQIDRAIDMGDALDDAKRGFESLGGSAGVVNKTADSIKNLVGTVDLFRSAAKAAMAGVPDFNKNFQLIAETATKVAEATGKDAAGAIDTFTQAVARGEPRMLRAYNVNIQGLSKELPLRERQNKMLREFISLDERLPELELGVADAKKSLLNIIDQEIAKVGAALNNNKQLADAIVNLGTVIKSTDWSPLVTALTKVVELTAKIGPVLTDAARGYNMLAYMAKGASMEQAAFLADLDTWDKNNKNRAAAAFGASGDSFVFGNKQTPPPYVPGAGGGGTAGKRNLPQYWNGSGWTTNPINLGGDLQVEKGFTDIFSNLFNPGGSFNSIIEQGLGNVFSQALSTIQSDASTQEKFTSIFSSALGLAGTALAGPVGGAIGGIVASIVGPTTARLVGMGDRAATSEDWFKGTSWAMAVPTFGGSLVPMALDKLGVTNIFGKNSSREQRRAASHQLNQMAGGNMPLNIGGSIRNVAPFEEGSYRGTPAEGFGGPGNALAKILAETGVSAKEFSNILSNNLGGSLNNLQMLMQKAGVTAEEMGEALKTLYLDGELGAKDFIKQSREIENLFQQGIPGAVGAVDEAFNNLVEGGMQSGRIAMDSLGDIAAEALERGFSSLEEIQQMLIESGASIEDVNRFMQALGQEGISSLEDLQNITLEQTAALVSRLQDMGFAFEAPIEGAKELKTLIEELNGAEANVTVNVRVNDPEGALAAFNSGGGEAKSYNYSDLSGQTGVSLNLGGATGSSYVFSGSGGGGGGGGIDTNRALEAVSGKVGDTVYGSDAFKTLLDSMKMGEITKEQAGTQLKQMLRRARKLILAKDKAEAMYERALMNPGAFSAKQLARIMARYMRLDERLSNFGNINAEGIAGFGNVEGAYSEFAGAGAGIRGATALRNIFIEAAEGNISMGELGIRLESQGFGLGGGLGEALAKRGINSIQAALQIDDTELIELVRELKRGLVIPVSVDTGQQTNGTGQNRRHRKHVHRRAPTLQVSDR